MASHRDPSLGGAAGAYDASSVVGAPDFATAVDHLLAKTDSLVEVRHTSVIETSALKQLVAMMARKLQLQENTIESQAAAIDELRVETARLRAENEAAQEVLVEVRRLARDVDEVRGDSKRQAMRLENAREETAAMHHDLSRLMAVAAAQRMDGQGRSSVASGAVPSRDRVVGGIEISAAGQDAAAAPSEASRTPFYGASLRASGDSAVIDQHYDEGGMQARAPRDDGAAARTEGLVSASPASATPRSALKRQNDTDGRAQRSALASAALHDHAVDQPPVTAEHARADVYDVPMTPPPSRVVAPIGAPPPGMQQSRTSPGAARRGTPSAAERASASRVSHQQHSTSATAASTSAPSSGHHRPLAGIDLTDTVTGPKITALKPGGPGAVAGLQTGDVVLRLNGKDVRSKHDFVGVLSKCVPGQCVDIAHRQEGHAIVVTKLYLGAASAPHRASN